ncbi:hypothetical protein [Ruegeria atlantica]|uniref:Tat pathway signal sequence domain protein n=1 Tax=Ruegeria atlantica TaxID=81569 RepID=A0A0P1E2S5_9RHOB|nr:hypothetical protein [Ruegeria atlantica]CUH42783.1 hypothetical protein RUM4293_01672 [Ruegeria atlantica]
MIFRRSALAVVFAALPLVAQAQSADEALEGLVLELNTVQDVGQACRLTFVIENNSGAAIDAVSYETVIFDASGSVVSLSLFNFRDLPVDRPRVRQFDLPGMTCGAVGKALINGANTCVVAGSDSQVCHEALKLQSRTDVELIG